MGSNGYLSLLITMKLVNYWGYDPPTCTTHPDRANSWVHPESDGLTRLVHISGSSCVLGMLELCNARICICPSELQRLELPAQKPQYLCVVLQRSLDYRVQVRFHCEYVRIPVVLNVQSVYLIRR